MRDWKTRMDQARWAAGIRKQIAYELGREGPPESFPALPPIPAGRYVDPGFYELERRHMWKKSWLLAGRDEDFPEPGSFRTFERTGGPLVIVRGRDGVLRAFFNTCQHRGATVVRDTCGTAKRLQCQYHSWVFDLDGRLLQVPDRRDFTELDESKRGLKPVGCEVYEGWVFINEDFEAPPLRRAFGPMADEWSVLHGSELRAVGHREKRVPVNWKIAVDAFLETYHLKTIHPQTVAKLLDHRGAAMTLFPGGHSRMITPKREAVLERQRAAAPLVRTIPGLDALHAETNPAYNLFPNLVTPLDVIGFPFLQFWPIDVATTDVEWTFYAMPPEDEAQEKFWEGFVSIFDGVMNEDFVNLEPMQRALASGALESIPLSYQERRIYHVHEEIDRMIGPENVPEELRVAPRLEPYWQGSFV